MLDLINVILPTFTVVLIGFLLGRLTKIDMSGIVEVLFYIGVPALAFVSMLDKKIILIDATKVWASALIIMAGCGIVAWLVFKMLGRRHSGLYLAIMNPNSANIPFPIISLVWGAEGLAGAVLFYIADTMLLYSMGVIILSRKHWQDGIKEMLKVPAIYAAVIGLTLNLFNVAVPALVLKQLSFISTMVVPLLLLVLGAKLSSVKIASLPTTAVSSVIRLGVGLLLGFGAAELFQLTGVLRAVVIFDSAMPAAVNTSLLAMKYDNEADLVSSVVFVTTIASLLMIPFLLHVLT